MRKRTFLKITLLVLAYVYQAFLFGIHKYQHGYAHSKFQGAYKSVFRSAYSSDERFTAIISPKDGLKVIHNDNQAVVLNINHVEINDFGFSSDNEYFFIDYRSSRNRRGFCKSSIDVFNLFLSRKVLTIPHYSLFSNSRRRKIDSCDFNDYMTFTFAGNNFAIKQKSVQSRTIIEMPGISTIKYCNGSDFFACFLKSGMLKICKMDNFEIKELFAFIPFSCQNPGTRFYRP